MGVIREKFSSFNHSTCKTVLNLLEAIDLKRRTIVVERVTVVNFGVDNRGRDGTSGCFIIKVRTDTAELTNMRIVGLRKDRLRKYRNLSSFIHMCQRALQKS